MNYFAQIMIPTLSPTPPNSGSVFQGNGHSPPTTTKAKATDGKKAIVGYFSKDMSRQLRVLAIEENTTVQALLGEGLDMLLRARGKRPFGER